LVGKLRNENGLGLVLIGIAYTKNKEKSTVLDREVRLLKGLKNLLKVGFNEI